MARPLGQPTQVMGVINLTPDSFSDGGRFRSPDQALRQAKTLVKAGVGVLDLGAQSTRPGAEDVGGVEELNRLLPSLQAIRSAFPPGLGQPLISVDTYRACVAQRAIEAGADWINDISGGVRDPDLLAVVAAADCPYVLMHSRGDSHSMD